jgi:hypothetical protein
MRGAEWIVLATLAATMAVSSTASAQYEVFVYRIVARECPIRADEGRLLADIPDEPRRTRVQTGVRVAGYRGIVTALHGVAGCERISGETGHSGARSVRRAQVTRVDIANDLAFLAAPEITDTAGIPLATSGCTRGEVVEVIGFPEAGEYHRRGWPRVEACSRPLREIFTSGTGPYNSIEARASPLLTSSVTSIDGVLTHGHSGAPILRHWETPDRVEIVALGSGGLRDGTTHVTWAIRAADVRAFLTRGEYANDAAKSTVVRALGYLFTEDVHFSWETEPEARDRMAAEANVRRRPLWWGQIGMRLGGSGSAFESASLSLSGYLGFQLDLPETGSCALAVRGIAGLSYTYQWGSLIAPDGQVVQAENQDAIEAWLEAAVGLHVMRDFEVSLSLDVGFRLGSLAIYGMPRAEYGVPVTLRARWPQFFLEAAFEPMYRTASFRRYSGFLAELRPPEQLWSYGGRAGAGVLF